jgi:hypothetical protein
VYIPYIYIFKFRLSDHLNHQLNPKPAKTNNFTNFSSLPPNTYSNQHPFTNTQPTNNNTYQMTNAEESPKDSNIKFSLGGYQNSKTKQFSKESKSKFSKNGNICQNIFKLLSHNYFV